ncbi:hypothetical protein [Streptomyces sp. N2A]|uniref:hypothetical protein n=1 Tax=Streptomyces sp. N2A TaxID=3073936 RepID=UPI00286FBBFC|nr:hypothetical protein [Streptomyces sp. N2A]
MAAGSISTSRRVRKAFGVAVVGSAVTSHLHGSLHTGLTKASHPGWWIITGCGVAVFSLGLLTTGRRARATAEATAACVAPDAGEPHDQAAAPAVSRGRA